MPSFLIILETSHIRTCYECNATWTVLPDKQNFFSICWKRVSQIFLHTSLRTIGYPLHLQRFVLFLTIVRCLWFVSYFHSHAGFREQIWDSNNAEYPVRVHSKTSWCSPTADKLPRAFLTGLRYDTIVSPKEIIVNILVVEKIFKRGLVPKISNFHFKCKIPWNWGKYLWFFFTVTQ